MNATADMCNGLGSFHCWHMTGKRAPATAPRDWAEFICCGCGKTRTAENYVFLTGQHGPHAPETVIQQGYSVW